MKTSRSLEMRTPFSDKSLVLIALSIIAISLLHYLTATGRGHFHEVYRLLYYIPIIFAAFRYGVRGGLTASIAVSLIYFPHVVLQWGGSTITNLGRFLELALYITVGFVTGIKAQREREQRQKYQLAARNLEKSYQHLQKQSEKLMEMEEQLRFSDRLAVLGELTASLAHEIRNPLGSIKGATEILQDEYPPDDPNYQFVQILLKEVDRLEKVVKNYLDVAKPGAANLQDCDLNELITSAVSLVSSKVRKKGVKIHIDPFPDAIPLKGDPTQLRQVLLNLLLNSLEATSKGDEISITMKVDDSTVSLSVADTGCGISRDNLKRIFDPFFTTRQGGTGLGLAICKRIIQQHGGEIKVKSDLGKGSVFTISLPLRRED